MRDDIRFLQELEADLADRDAVAGQAPGPRGAPTHDRARHLGGMRPRRCSPCRSPSARSSRTAQSARRERVELESSAWAAPRRFPAPAAPGTSWTQRELQGRPRPGTQTSARAPPPGRRDDVGWRPAAEQKQPRRVRRGTQTDLSKIIRDGAIAVTVPTDSFRDQSAKVVAIANQNGGSVLSSTTQSGTSGTFTLRIPASRFDKAMVQLAQLGSVDSSSVQGKDVTADYMDAKAHLKIYLTHRKFLYGLMAKATTTGEALALEHQLQQTQLQIDQITGQIRYLDNQVAEATLRVDLHEPGSEPKTASDIENPSLGNAFSRAIQGFLNVIAVMLIGFGYLIPLLVIAAVAYAIVRLVQRRRTAA